MRQIQKTQRSVDSQGNACHDDKDDEDAEYRDDDVPFFIHKLGSPLSKSVVFHQSKSLPSEPESLPPPLSEQPPQSLSLLPPSSPQSESEEEELWMV